MINQQQMCPNCTSMVGKLQEFVRVNDDSTTGGHSMLTALVNETVRYALEKANNDPKQVAIIIMNELAFQVQQNQALVNMPIRGMAA